MVHRGYYAIIPAHVRYDKDLTDGAKLLYGEITALCNEKGFCWASDTYFMDLYKVSRSTVQRWFKQLESKGYIKRVIKYKDGSKEIEQRYTYLCDNPMLKNETTPMLKNETDNITDINNEEEEINPVKLFEKNFYPMTPVQMNSLWQWVDDFNGNKEIVCMAIKETALKNPNSPFKYLERILIDWHKRKLFTRDDVLREKKKYEANKKQRAELSYVPPMREIDFSEGEDY